MCGSLWSGETWLVLGFPVAWSSGRQRQIPGDPPSGQGGRGGAGGLPWASRLPGAGRRAGFWSVIPVPERGPWAGQRCVHGGRFPTGFPGDSDGEEPACRAGDEASVPGLGSSPGEGHSCPLGYSCLGPQSSGSQSDAAEPLTSLLFRCPDGETSQSGPSPRGLGAQAGMWRVAAPPAARAQLVPAPLSAGWGMCSRGMIRGEPRQCSDPGGSGSLQTQKAWAPGQVSGSAKPPQGHGVPAPPLVQHPDTPGQSCGPTRSSSGKTRRHPGCLPRGRARVASRWPCLPLAEAVPRVLGGDAGAPRAPRCPPWRHRARWGRRQGQTRPGDFPSVTALCVGHGRETRPRSHSRSVCTVARPVGVAGLPFPPETTGDQLPTWVFLFRF